MRQLFKERKLFKGGNYMRKYGNFIFNICWVDTYIDLRYNQLIIEN